MVSPFRRHQQHVRGLISGACARNAAALTPPEPDAASAEGQEYALLRVLLHDNLRSLADIQSIEARNPRKADYAKAFADWIEGVLAAGNTQDSAAQDEILVTNMIWAFDYRDIDYGLRLAAHAIRFHLALPGRFKSTLPCFVAETVADIALDSPAAVTHAQLLALVGMLGEADMPDQVKAKLAKAVGRSYAAAAEAFDPSSENAAAGGKAALTSAALEWLTRARSLDAKKAGVAKEIEALTRAMKTLGNSAENQP